MLWKFWGSAISIIHPSAFTEVAGFRRKSAAINRFDFYLKVMGSTRMPRTLIALRLLRLVRLFGSGLARILLCRALHYGIRAIVSEHIMQHRIWMPRRMTLYNSGSYQSLYVAQRQGSPLQIKCLDRCDSSSSSRNAWLFPIKPLYLAIWHWCHSDYLRIDDDFDQAFCKAGCGNYAWLLLSIKWALYSRTNIFYRGRTLHPLYSRTKGYLLFEVYIGFAIAISRRASCRPRNGQKCELVISRDAGA